MICSVCGNDNPAGADTCLRCGAATAQAVGGRPAVGPVGPVYPLSALANVLTVLFPIDAALLIFEPTSHPSGPSPAVTGLSFNAGPLGLASAAMMLATVVVFLNWFYRARKNASRSGWRQRWSPGWAIGSWFLPPVLLWFPYQIMADIWRAGRAPERRQSPSDATLPGLWWAFWVLAWITSFQHTSRTTITGTSSSYALNFGATWPSAFFGAAAAITLVVIIRIVSAGPVATDVAAARAAS